MRTMRSRAQAALPLALMFGACGDDRSSGTDTAVTGDTAAATATAATDTVAATDTAAPSDATASDGSDTVAGCAGGQITFKWGDPPHTVTDAVAPIQFQRPGEIVTLECPDDWFGAAADGALTDEPVSVVWTHTRVADDPWEAYRAAFQASASVWDFVYLDYGTRLSGTFEVVSSSGQHRSYAVTDLEPGPSENVTADAVAISFYANESRAAGAYATIPGVGQDMPLARVNVRWDAVGTWIAIETPDDFSPTMVPAGGGPADLEIIQPCLPVGFSYRFPSTPFADWEGPDAETHTAEIVLRDRHLDEVRGLNAFGMVPTSMTPAWEHCDVDYTFRFRVDDLENR